jgi:hypothetical protein
MSSRGEVLSEKISAGMNAPQAEVDVCSGSMRSNTSFFLEILEGLCLDILDSVFLDWIWPFGWAYSVLVASAPAYSDSDRTSPYD